MSVSAATSAPTPFGLTLYRGISRAAGPAARLALAARLKAGKEEADRLGERRGEPGAARPAGPLIWIHGASVGEALSVLPLVARLRTERPGFAVLTTTGTVTSAALMAERLPPPAIHQYAPIDHPRYVRRFLDHWRPDAALFIESELWPNLLLESQARVGFLALVNGRMSPTSHARWTRRPRTIARLLDAFDALIAQDGPNATRLAELAGRAVDTFGNLKNAAAPLPADETALAAFRRRIVDRPAWLAASTHPGEEVAVADAHAALKSSVDGLLTILAPRHPARGAEIAHALAERGLMVARRGADAPVTPDTDVYLADTLGELGLFYRLAPVAFVGGSIAEKGGHNPLEPARLGCAILHGPHTFNFAETYARLREAGGAGLVRNGDDLAAAARRLLRDDKTRTTMADAARAAADEAGDATLDQIFAAILPALDAAAAPAPPSTP